MGICRSAPCRDFPSRRRPTRRVKSVAGSGLIRALSVVVCIRRCNEQTRHECGAIDHHHDRVIASGNPIMAVRRLSVALALLCGLAAGVAASSAEDRAIVMATTTATQESGLLDYLLPIFREKTGIEVTVIARRADEVLDGARRGEVDVVLMHARPQEEKFVADGFGVKRFDVMYNDYVLIGPKSDPAKVAGGKDILEAFRKVKNSRAPFVSRGDRSGTHFAELEIWK